MTTATGTRDRHLRCLFRDYPTAAMSSSRGLAMTLAMPGLRYTRISDSGGTFRSRPYIETSDLETAVPVPADDQLYGWLDRRGDIAAIMPVFNQYTGPGSPEPVLSVMVRAGHGQWPGFVHSEFGSWFWDDVDAGRLIRLNDLIRTHPHQIYWVNGTSAGSVGVVARPVQLTRKLRLLEGTYVHHSPLRVIGAPSREELATCPRWTDAAQALRP
jgi:hypothetical protein